MDRAGSAFPELGLDLQFLPRDFTRQGGRGEGCRQWVACERKPSQFRHLQEPFRESGKVVGSDAQEFELGAVGEAFRQFGQAIAGEHQLLQVRALAEGLRELLQAVVREDQPAQVSGQRFLSDRLDVIGLEADHAEMWAIAEDRRQMIERVIRAEQDSQLGQATEIVRKRTQLVAAEVEDFQGVGEIEDLVWEIGQAALEVQAGLADKLAGSELRQGVHDAVPGAIGRKNDEACQMLLAAFGFGGLAADVPGICCLFRGKCLASFWHVVVRRGVG